MSWVYVGSLSQGGNICGKLRLSNLDGHGWELKDLNQVHKSGHLLPLPVESEVLMMAYDLSHFNEVRLSHTCS